MPATGKGWQLELVRMGQHQGADFIRTFGRYRVFIDGQSIDELSGFMCECQGPCENEVPCTEQNRRRIREGTYNLETHYTKYSSARYSTTATYPTPENPMPGFGLAKTGVRKGILLHPAHDGGLYLASIGCLNPTHSLAQHENMDINDSRTRVIALLNSLRRFCPTAFSGSHPRMIAGASIVIVGEPLNLLE